MSEDNIFNTIRVEGELLFNKDRVKLLELFKSQGFDDQQSDELANAMKRAVYYLRKDRVERKKIEKATMKELRGDWKKKIGITKTLLEKENIEFLNESVVLWLYPFEDHCLPSPLRTTACLALRATRCCQPSRAVATIAA